MPLTGSLSPRDDLGYQREVVETSAGVTSAHNRVGDLDEVLELQRRGVVNLSPTVSVDDYPRPHNVLVGPTGSELLWSADRLGESLPGDPRLVTDLLKLAVSVEEKGQAVKRFIVRHGPINFPWRKSPWQGATGVELRRRMDKKEQPDIVVVGSSDPSLRRQPLADYDEVAEVVFCTLKLFLARLGPLEGANDTVAGPILRAADFLVLTKFLSKRLHRTGVVARLLLDGRLARAVANRTELSPEDWKAERLTWCSAVFDLFAASPGHGGQPLAPVLREREPGHLEQFWAGGANNVLAMSLMAIFTERRNILTCTFCRRLYGARRRAKRSAKTNCCSDDQCVRERRRLSMAQSRTRGGPDRGTDNGGIPS